jgi:hypothetical protein
MSDRETGNHAANDLEVAVDEVRRRRRVTITSSPDEPLEAAEADDLAAFADDASAIEEPIPLVHRKVRPYEPMRMKKPCRIIHVERGERTYHLIGETHGHEGLSSVRWRIQSFSCAAYGDIGAERLANETGLRFARRLPPWFNGSSYFADSVGRVVQIEPLEDAAPADDAPGDDDA